MATLQERLTEAEAAYHALNTGTAVVEVRDGGNGDSIRYTAANAGRLAAYIADLKAQLGLTPTEYSRPMRVIF